MYYRTKKQVHILLHPTVGNSKLDKIINTFLITLIILNVIVVILETEHDIYIQHQSFFKNFDTISVIIFSIEYVLRVWSATHEKKYKHWFWGRLRYMLTWGALIDLVSILPFYLHAFIVLDLRVFRILRLLRLLRVFRLASYMKSTRMIINVFRTRAHELSISLILIVGLIIVSACVMYFVEHPAQPDKFSSILATLWWSIVTLTTVGYGDIIPVTLMGKILTAVISLCGVALFALPAGIITAGFLEEIKKIKKPRIHNCPHCGQPLNLHEHSDADH
jgi:voltage-gated potassium channel